MKLKQVKIYKYKSIESEQEFEVDDTVTVFVGMNESGKTAILEAMAKSRYFENDSAFRFNSTHDYPRKEKKAMDKSGRDPVATTLTYELDDSLCQAIAADVGEGVFEESTLVVDHTYKNTSIYRNVSINKDAFCIALRKKIGKMSDTLLGKLLKVKNADGFAELLAAYKDETILSQLRSVESYFANQWKWASQPVAEYIARTH